MSETRKKFAIIGAQSFLDTCAVTISGLCAVHCLALPLVLLAFPILGGTVFTDELFHQVLLWFILPTSIFAVALGVRHRFDAVVIALVSTGLALLITAALWAHDYAEPWVDTALSLSGGLILAVGHVRNLLLCRTAI